MHLLQPEVSSSTPQDSVILPSCGIAVLIIHTAKLNVSGDTSEASGTATSLHHACITDEFLNSTAVGNDHVASFPKQQQRSKQMSKKKEKNDDAEEWQMESMDQLVSRVDAFMRGHRIGVVLLVGSVFAEEEIGGGVMGVLQSRLMPSPPLILPAHGDAQVAEHIEIISKVCQTEMRGVVQGRMEEMISSVLNKEQNVIIGRAMGLNYHQASVLMDSFGSVGSVAAASAADIHQQTPLDAASAATVAAFLARDTVSL